MTEFRRRAGGPVENPPTPGLAISLSVRRNVKTITESGDGGEGT